MQSKGVRPCTNVSQVDHVERKTILFSAIAHMVHMVHVLSELCHVSTHLNHASHISHTRKVFGTALGMLTMWGVVLTCCVLSRRGLQIKTRDYDIDRPAAHRPAKNRFTRSTPKPRPRAPARVPGWPKTLATG
jgi:hypothetical protein